MFKLTKLIHFAGNCGQPERDAVAAALRRSDGQVLVQPTLAGVYNGGDLVAHFQFEDEREWNAAEPQIAATLASAAVGHVDSVAYAGGRCGESEPRLEKGVYRTLLLCVDRPVDPAVIEQFEAEMRMMPHYIPAIRNWQLSRVAHASGSRRWTHVWEQEYSGIEGLMGPYMMHPYHWARVDRWFDPESPEWMISTTLCHSFCPLERSIVGQASGRADGSRVRR